MSFLNSIRDAFGAQEAAVSKDGPRRILLFGDSHVHAIREAIRHRTNAGIPTAIEARRLLKPKKKFGEPEEQEAFEDAGPLPWYARIKGPRKGRHDDPRASSGVRQGEADGATIGDTTLEEFLQIARSLRPTDVLISAIGGNQHAVVSTIQHPQRFDFILPGDEQRPVDNAAELIPYRSLYEYFANGIRTRDGKTLEALRAATQAQIVHLPAPPPKASNAFIKDYHDTQFKAQGISELGVSAPELRLKFWRLQNRALDELCDELDIEMLPVPPKACDPKGFLARPFYARDATHANAAYGELVVAQLEERFQRGEPGNGPSDGK
jgi:hypothetical protein